MICFGVQKIDGEIVITELFRLGMLWRIGYGGLRLFFGLVLLKLVGSPVGDLMHKIMGHELIEDPTDLLYRIVEVLFSHHSFQVTYFLAFYFIFWGLLDIVLSVYLLRGKLWAFPLSLLLIASFVIYELFRYTHTHSPFLLSIIVVDIIVMGLIYKEWKLVKGHVAGLHSEEAH